MSTGPSQLGWGGVRIVKDILVCCLINQRETVYASSVESLIMMYTFYCSNLQVSTKCGKVIPLVNLTQLLVIVVRYIVSFVCELTFSPGPMGCDHLTSFVTHTLRDPSVSRTTRSAVQLKCTESSRL